MLNQIYPIYNYEVENLKIKDIGKKIKEKVNEIREDRKEKINEIKEKIKERKEERKEKLKEIGHKIKDKASKAKLAMLAPFIPVMKAMLSKRGLNPENSLDDLAHQFYRVIIKGETYVKNFENFDPVTISVIVSAIVSFIKGIIEKKKQGKQLSNEEEVVLAASEEAVKEYNEETEKDNKMIYIVGGIIALLVVLKIAKVF